MTTLHAAWSRTVNRIRRRDEAGVAMAVATGVAMILFLVVSALATNMLASYSQARRTAATSESRLSAESVMDYLYVAANENPDFFTGGLFASALGYSGGASAAKARFNPLTGLLEACPDHGTGDCFNFTINYDNANGTATISVVSEAKCGASAAQCKHVQFEQRMRRRQFFDYLYMTDSELLDPDLYPNPGGTAPGGGVWAQTNCPLYNGAPPRPFGCQEVAYAAGDNVDGPIHSNDRHVLICGSPTFRGPVEARDGTSAVVNINKYSVRAPACGSGNGSPSYASGGGPVNGAAALVLPTTTSSYSTLAPAKYRYPAGAANDTVDIVLNSSGTMSVSCATCTGSVALGTVPLPDSGVIYSDRTVQISGTLKGKLTVFSTRDIRIVNDLRYNTAATNLNSPDALGLAANGSIIIVPTTTSGTISADRTIEAVMVALNHSVSVTGWDTVPGGGRVLTIRGAIVGRYRGAYGGYDPATAATATGYTKAFSYDRRMQRIQPPYFLQPVNTSWVRADITEVRCPASNPLCVS